MIYQCINTQMPKEKINKCANADSTCSEFQ